MTRTGTAAPIGERGLSEQARSALSSELFARWHAAEPDKHHCFCGPDRDLIAAVERFRHAQDRQTDDRNLLDRERG